MQLTIRQICKIQRNYKSYVRTTPKMGVSYDYYELDGYIVRVQKGFKWDGKLTGELVKNIKIEKENENGSWENYPFAMDFLSWGKKLEEYTPIADK